MKQIKVNLQESDYNKLSDMAASQGITMAELIRRQFNFSIENTFTKKAHQQIDPSLLYEINKISYSLSKIAENISKDIEINSRILLEIHQKIMSLI